MHATADTTAVKFNQRLGAARDARRYASASRFGNVVGRLRADEGCGRWKVSRGAGAANLSHSVGRVRMAGACGGNLALRHNKRMHATADTQDFINSRGLGRRVMRGVSLLLNSHP